VCGLIFGFWRIGAGMEAGLSMENICKKNPTNNNSHPEYESMGESIVTTATFGIPSASAHPFGIPTPMRPPLQII